MGGDASSEDETTTPVVVRPFVVIVEPQRPLGNGAVASVDTVTPAAAPAPAPAAPTQRHAPAPTTDASPDEASDDATTAAPRVRTTPIASEGEAPSDGESDPNPQRRTAPTPPREAPASAEAPQQRTSDAADRPLVAERGSASAVLPALAQAESVQAEIDAARAKPAPRAAEAPVEPRATGARGAEAAPVERPAQPAAPAPLQRGEPTLPFVRAEAESPAPLVARGLAALVAQKGGTMQIRLDPPSLGDVRIELTIRQGAVVAEITASSASTQTLLARELGSLHGALERQGLLVERIGVHAPPARPADGSGAQPFAADAARGESAAQRGGDGQQQRSGDGRHDAGGGASRGRGEQDPGTEQDRRQRRMRASFARIWSEVEV